MPIWAEMAGQGEGSVAGRMAELVVQPQVLVSRAQRDGSDSAVRASPSLLLESVGVQRADPMETAFTAHVPAMIV